MSTLLFDRAWIAKRIPHQGSMCLLDGVAAWDDTRIRCLATSHRDTTNPLRRAGRLGAATGIEYAAQAMAVHGALVTDQATPPRVGFLASVRSVELHADRLDDIAAPLSVEAERISGNDTTILYEFTVSAEGRRLLAGRAVVIAPLEQPA